MDTEAQSDTQFCEASTRKVITTSHKKKNQQDEIANKVHPTPKKNIQSMMVHDKANKLPKSGTTQYCIRER